MMNDGNELMHYGVLGMKWGVRRYRNKDGSLTPVGKKKLKKYVNDETGELTYKGLMVFGNKVKTSAYLKEVKDNKKIFPSKKLYNEYLDMTKKMDDVETKRLSKKGKEFLNDVMRNVDLKKYGTSMSLNEIEEDYYLDYND